METKHKIQKVIHQINRKLILLLAERKAAKRKEIIDSITLDEEGELHQLKELVGLPNKD